jgi:hypothetical protein
MSSVRKITFASFVMAGCALAAGCTNRPIPDDRGFVSLARNFYSGTVDERMRSFASHPLEEQYNLYLFGNQRRHPPAIYLARCFALNGRAAVELLRAKLELQETDLTVRDIVMLLATIDRMRMYDVAGDAELMKLLEVRVTAMQDREWRESSTGRMQRIGQGREDVVGYAPSCRALNR